MQPSGAAMQLLYVPAPDVADVLLGVSGGGRKLERSLAQGLVGRTDVDAAPLLPGGWAGTAAALEATRPDGPLVVVTSVSAELADPGPRPAPSLAALARAIHAREGRLVVLNASSAVPKGSAELGGHGPDLAIRQANLAAIEASHETGLSILDADRIVGESTAFPKVLAPFDYTLEICEALRVSFITILGDLGLAAQPLLEARVPFVRQASRLRVERWLKSEGDEVGVNEPICDIRIDQVRRLSRPTSAVVLASMDGRTSALRRLVSRQRVRRRGRVGVLSLVARERAVLRKILRPAGARVSPGEGLALLTRDGAAPILRHEMTADLFRAALRTEDPVIESML